MTKRNYVMKVLNVLECRCNKMTDGVTPLTGGRDYIV